MRKAKQISKQTTVELLLLAMIVILALGVVRKGSRSHAFSNGHKAVNKVTATLSLLWDAEARNPKLGSPRYAALTLKALPETQGAEKKGGAYSFTQSANP